MPDKLMPRTAIDRGPNEEPIELDRAESEFPDEAGGDTAASEIDSNVGGAPSSAGLDSGGAVGVRRGRAVGRPGFEYENAERGETSSDVRERVAERYERRAAALPDWADTRMPRGGE